MERTTERTEQLARLVADGQNERVAEELGCIHPGEAAVLLRELPRDSRVDTLLALPPEQAADILEELPDDMAAAAVMGMEPDAAACSPGRLAHLATIQRAIRQGHRALDLLRGDEPYKAHWRARPHPMVRLRVVPARVGPQLRHGLWAAGRHMKEWIKKGLRVVGARED